MSNTRFDVLVLGGTLVTSQGGSQADVAIANGRIEMVARDLSGVSADRVIDASGKLVLPGIIDAHTHPVYLDDLEGTSISGVHGGVTTQIAYVGPNPAWSLAATTLLDSVRKFVEEGEGRSVADFAVHGTVMASDDVLPQIPILVEMGVVSFKFFMMYRKRGMMLADDHILRVMDAVVASGGIACVHAENGAAIDYLTDKLSATAPVGNDAYLGAHRDLLEAEAVFRAMALAEAARCPLYVPHVAVKEGVEMAARFRGSLPMPLLLETCPHYLVLTNDEVLRRGPLAKIAPPIRETHDNEALWQGLRDGTIDVVASDHCGHALESKMECTHILDARFGAPGIEQLLTVMYSEGVRKGRISLGRLVQVLCENPARIFGLYPRKGCLVPSADADLVLFDPEVRRPCSAETHHSRSGFCLYEGMETVGAPILVMQRGRVVVENGNLVGKPGDGKFLPGRNPIWQY